MGVNITNKNIGFIIIVLHFFLEFLVKFLLFIGVDKDPGNSIIVYCKMFIFIGLLWFAVLNFNSNKRLLLILLFIGVLGLFGWFTYIQSVDAKELYIFVKTMARYTYPFLWMIFFSLLSSKQLINSQIGFRVVLFVNTLLIITGYVFNISLFASYTNRFGYDGVFYLANDASAFYFLGLALIYNRFLSNRDWVNVLELIFVLIGILMLGTKTAYLFLILFSVYHICISKKYLQSALVITLTLTIIFVSGIFNFFLDLANSTSIGSSVFSFRNELVNSRIVPLIKDWFIINYLFGGCNYLDTYVQMDIIDVFIFFGIVGGSLYLGVFLKEVFYIKGNRYLLYIGILYIILGGLAGHFYPSGVVAIYLALVSLLLKNRSIESRISSRLANRVRWS